MDVHDIFSAFAPATHADAMLSLSGVTGGFYALLLKSVKDCYPEADLNKISQHCFKSIGVLKSTEYLSKRSPSMMDYKDTRGCILTLVMAIFNASPEYIFNVEKFDREHSIITLTGKDRYLRSANACGIADQIQFPTLTEFLKGAAETIGIECKVEAHELSANGADELFIRYEVTLIE